MILPYYLRLLCLCLATFFVVHALGWLAVRSMAAAVVRIAGTMRPRMASRFLFALRMAPAAVSVFLIVGFCVPSYVWLEPDLATERVGWFCLLAAASGAAVWAVALLRSTAAVVLTGRYMRRCQARAQSGRCALDCFGSDISSRVGRLAVSQSSSSPRNASSSSR